MMTKLAWLYIALFLLWIAPGYMSRTADYIRDGDPELGHETRSVIGVFRALGFFLVVVAVIYVGRD